MFILREATFFATIISATTAERLLPRAVNCQSLGLVGTAASSYCSSVLRISTVTIRESVTVIISSTSQHTIGYTSTSTESVTGSVVTATGAIVTHTQTKTITSTKTSCSTALQKRASVSSTTEKYLSSSAPPKCSTAPAGLESFKCRDLSKACSCLHLPTKTVSATSTVSSVAKTTAVKTSTSVKIVTSSAKGRTTTIHPTHSLTVTHTSTTTTCLCAYPTPNFCSGSCVDFNSDTDHCGACNNPCPDAAFCVGGLCVCPYDTDLCSDGCIDTSSDPENCGGCDKKCEDGTVCTDGSCVCPVGQTSCASGCADLSSDPSNCAACGRACGEGDACCGGTCADLSSDDDNCGFCGHECFGSTLYCISRSCSCPSPYGICNGLCEDLTTWYNCGVCGNMCNEQAGLFCFNGKNCTCDPDAELQEMYCPDLGQCVSTHNNPEHCGSCKNACPEYWYCLDGDCIEP